MHTFHHLLNVQILAYISPSKTLRFLSPPEPCSKTAAKGKYLDADCNVVDCSNANAGQYYTGGAPKGKTSCPVGACKNAAKGFYYTGVAPVGSIACPVHPCTNAEQGQYFTGSAPSGKTSCPVAQCMNAQKGQYYKDYAPAGKNACPVAACTNKLAKDQFFITDGGKSPVGCKIGGGTCPSLEQKYVTYSEIERLTLS